MKNMYLKSTGIQWVQEQRRFLIMKNRLRITQFKNGIIFRNMIRPVIIKIVLDDFAFTKSKFQKNNLINIMLENWTLPFLNCGQAMCLI